MRIVNLNEFIKLPQGVLYTLYEPAILGELEIKGETNDLEKSAYGTVKFYSAALNDCLTEDILYIDPHRKASFSMTDENYTADVYYPDQLFAVWEQADIQFLQGLLQRAYIAAGALEKVIGESVDCSDTSLIKQEGLDKAVVERAATRNIKPSDIIIGSSSGHIISEILAKPQRYVILELIEKSTLSTVIYSSVT